MAGHLRIASPWSQLGIFLGLFGGAFLLSSFLMLAILLLRGIPMSSMNNIDWNDAKIVSTMKLAQAFSSVIMFLLPGVLYAVFTFSAKPFYFLGFKKAERATMYGLAIFCLLVAFPFVFWLGELNQHIPMQEWMTRMEKDALKQMEALLRVHAPMDIVVNLFIIAVLPAICEEICFRGALQRILINCTRSPWTGIILTSILFSALHLQFQGFLPRMFLGIVLGALYWYSGSLWTSILAHFVTNAVQVIAVSYAPKYVNENPSVPLLAVVISAIFVFAGLWFYKRMSTVTYARVFRTDELNRYNEFLT